ncbi:hypothetical protein JHK86_042122 [Glycine max]|nr:hypothetical protein JHK86_042122 [Glycine max]
MACIIELREKFVRGQALPHPWPCPRFLPGAAPASNGMTAIAMGMAKSLELETPFAMITASEIFSLQILKTKAPSLSTSRKKPKSSRFKWTVPRHELLSIHMPAYSDSIVKGVSTVMVQTPVGMV